jgi:hypothetical protein
MHIPFRPIARLLSNTLRPTPNVEYAAQHLLTQLATNGKGTLITVNHYYAPDFHAWWFVILISALFPVDIHWVVTSGWANSGWLDGFTHWLFPLGAKLLGFTSMPAMPPNPRDVEARASAVRDVLGYVRKTPNAVVGLTPEGGDSPDGALAPLPPGVGRFMYLLSKPCPNFLPVGVWKENGRIQLKFGQPYELDLPEMLSSSDLDCTVGEVVMHHIAELLPLYLRGKYQ